MEVGFVSCGCLSFLPVTFLDGFGEAFFDEPDWDVVCEKAGYVIPNSTKTNGIKQSAIGCFEKNFKPREFVIKRKKLVQQNEKECRYPVIDCASC